MVLSSVGTANTNGATTPNVVLQKAPPDPTLTRAVTTAVNQLNASGFAGEGREVTIALDPGTHQPVVRVVDIDTNEVLRQWPSKYALQLAEAYKSRASE